MKILISHGIFETKNLTPFTKEYQHLFVSVSEDFEEMHGRVSVKNVINELNYSWDGEVVTFAKEDAPWVLSRLEEWFKDDANHEDCNDFEISNCVVVKETEHSLLLLDPVLQETSTMSRFYDQLLEEKPDLKMFRHDDCHLVSHLSIDRFFAKDDHLGLDKLVWLHQMYKEGVLDDTVFLFSLDQMIGVDGFHPLPMDKDICLTGALPIERARVSEILTSVGFKIQEKVTANTWLWMGEGVGRTKVEKAQEKGARCSTMKEVGEMIFQAVIENSTAAKNASMKPRMK